MDPSFFPQRGFEIQPIETHYQWLGINRAPARSDVEREEAAREGGPHNCDSWSTCLAVIVSDDSILVSTDHQAELYKLPYR